MSSDAAMLPVDVVKLQAAVDGLQKIAQNMKRRKKEYCELAKAADSIQRAVATSCKRKAMVNLPLFAQPVVDIATRVLAQCAAHMEETELNGVPLFRRFKLKEMREDCMKAIEAFRYILQIDDGHSLLIESDGDIKFPQPPGWEADNSELGKRISSWDTIWDGIKVLLAGTVNATDGARIAMGPEPIKAIVQTVMQLLKHVEDYHASKESVGQLQATIEIYWAVVLENYVSSGGACDALDERVLGFLRLLQRTVIRLYLLRATPWLKRFIAVPTTNDLIATEKRALEEAKNAITLALGFSTNAGVRENRLEIVRGYNQVEGVGELVRGVAGMFQKARDRDKLERWLAIGRNVDDRQRELQAMVTASPDWFFDETFDQWKNAEKGSSMGVYWISSDPGSGKSVLLSAVVQHLPPEERVFFHFDMRNGQPTLRDFLAAVVLQLGHRLGGYPSALINACEKGYEQTASEEILRDAATEMLSSAPMILAIDALDECPKLLDRWKSVQSLLDALRGTGTRIIVTSRRGNYQLVQYLTNHAGHCLHLNDSAHHHVLLEEYIDARLAEFLWSVEQKVKVADILKAKSEGMFLWVSLHLGRMQSASPRLVEDMLHEIPESLDDTYRTIIEDFSSSPAVINSVSHVLQCLALSRENLSPRQVAELLASFEFPHLAELPPTNPPYQRLLLPVVQDDIQEPEAFVLSRLPALLRITEDESGGKVIRFIHLSIVEYLQSAACRSRSLVRLYAFSLGAAHMTWLRICLTVLENSISFDLTRYAKGAWVYHISCLVNCNEDVLADYLTPAPASLKDLFNLIESVHGFSCFALACRDGQISFIAWFLAHGADVTGSPGTSWKMSPLQVATYYGHIGIAELLVRHGASDSVASTGGWTALCFAAFHGNTDLCCFLLDNGSDVLHTGFWGDTALHLAASQGHLEVARLLLDRQASMTAHDVNGWTALHLAAAGGHYELCSLLLDKGSDIMHTGLWGATALHLAASEGHLEIARLLLDRQASITAHDDNGWTALHRASQGGHYELCSLLLDKGSDIMHSDLEGSTALHLAASNGHLEVACLLLDRQASITAHDDNGWTALHRAAYGGHPDLCSLLLDKGSDIMHTGFGGDTALHLAASKGHLEVACLLLDRQASITAHNETGWTALLCAAAGGHNELCYLLLDEGSDIMHTSLRGETALHLAASEGHLEVARLLLDRQASITACDVSGRTALLRAAAGGHNELCSLLLDKGSDIMHTSLRGETALHIAASEGHLEVARLLLDRHASITARDGTGWTALLCAAAGGHYELCSLLLDKGSDIMHTSLQGDTALHLAALEGHPEVPRLLLDRHASITHESGWTALLCATYGGHSDLCSLLLDNGSDIMHTGLWGDTALRIAASRGHLKVARLLLDRQASITAHNETGWTALLCAAYGGHLDLCSLLLDKGSDIMHTDLWGYTALHIAASRGHLEVARLLLDRHASITHDEDGHTPRDIAEQEGHDELVAFFSSWEQQTANDAKPGPDKPAAGDVDAGAE